MSVARVIDFLQLTLSSFAKNKKKLGYYMDLSKFNATTSLQKAAKDYVMAGGEFSSGKGLLVTKDIIG